MPQTGTGQVSRVQILTEGLVLAGDWTFGAGNGGQVDCRESRPRTLSGGIKLKNGPRMGPTTFGRRDAVSGRGTFGAKYRLYSSPTV